VDGKIVGAIGVSGAPACRTRNARRRARTREVSSADDRAGWGRKRLFIFAGSNVGDREANLRAAIAALGDASVV